MEVVFIVSAIFIAYTYAIYPAIIVAWGTFFPRRVEKRYRTVPVSIVVAARNEELRIVDRITNLREQDYPEELVEIIVVSDGSTDATAERARSCAGTAVIEAEAQGKSAALNLGVAQATHDIVVFTDARQRFGANVLADLVAMLNDPAVGGVSGELIIEPTEGSEVSEGVGLYWRYEKLIRRKESAVWSVVGASGSIYAIRRDLYVPLEPHALLDDFLVPMRIVLAGHRVVFARSARAFDSASPNTKHEFRRKVRTLAGNFQAMAMEPRLMSPRRNPVFFEFVSHKVARLMVPYFCLAALVSSGLAGGSAYRAAFYLQLVFYGVGLLNLTPLRRARLARLFRVSWTFVVLNAAAVVGLWVFARGKDRAVWKNV